MLGLSLIVAAGLGAIAGSFLNALLARYNTGRSMGGRSQCMCCGAMLKAADLLPIFSFLFLMGRCRHCGSRISSQYLLVELAATALGAGVYLLHPEPFAFALWFVIWMVLLFIVVYDIRHTIIPPVASILLALLALCVVMYEGGDVWRLAAGAGLAAPLFFLSLVSRGTWMGWGDSGLQFSIGVLLGWSAGLTALLLAFWIGAASGIALMLFQSRGWRLSKTRLTIKSEIPFAPFLVLGAAVCHFFHVDLFSSLTLIPQLLHY